MTDFGKADFDLEKLSSPTPASIPIMIVGTFEDSPSLQNVKTDCVISKEYKARSLLLVNTLEDFIYS